MSDIIVTKDQQLIITVRHEINKGGVSPKIWHGCLEIERKDYTMEDIANLANDDPQTISQVVVMSLPRDFSVSPKVITDDVLDYMEAKP